MPGCWYSAVFRDIIPKRYDPIILFVEDRINGEGVFIVSRESLDSIPVILQVILQTRVSIQTLLSHYCTQQGFPFSSHLFDHPGHSGDWNFLFLCQSCQMTWVVFGGLFNSYLAYNLRSSNVVKPNEQLVCWRSGA